MKASIDSIETFGLVDGPGIRTVVFFNNCKLRCKYCHNPEMWTLKDNNYDIDEVFEKIMRSKAYYGKIGGVTFSGGEPLLHQPFLLELCKKLKEAEVGVCLDTAGVGLGNYEELLEYVDLVLLDVKHTNPEGYKDITGVELDEVEKFIDACNKTNKRIWIRQVIIPGVNDNEEYIDSLIDYLKHINNIERVDFLPFHRMGREKYIKLKIPYPYEDKPDMDKVRCDELFKLFMEKYKAR